MDTHCLVCNKPANWVRATQFAGDHPYCQEHAEQEKDFGKDGGTYFTWCRISSDGVKE